MCTDASLGRQYDYLAKPPKDRSTYVAQHKAACRPLGPAKLQQDVVQSNDKTRVVEVRFVTGSGTGSTRIRLTDSGDGYRVDRVTSAS